MSNLKAKGGITGARTLFTCRGIRMDISFKEGVTKVLDARMKALVDCSIDTYRSRG